MNNKIYNVICFSELLYNFAYLSLQFIDIQVQVQFIVFLFQFYHFHCFFVLLKHNNQT